MMLEETFWELVDEARDDASNDDERFLEVLEKGLMALPPNAIEGFRECLDDVLARAYRWDLWAAAYIINGGASDDGFQYFRAWLISRGRGVFEQALADPAGLEMFVPNDPEWLAEFEEMLYLPVYVLEQKTGEEVPLPEPLETTEEIVAPKGEPWDESTVETLFPGLARQAKARLSRS
jgi:hypothetical protein